MVSGSAPAAAAISSMKLSTAKAFWLLPTERQNITGTCVFFRMQSTVALGNA